MSLLTIVHVQLIALGAALAAMALGTAGYLLRRALGLVSPPPSADDQNPH